MCGIIIKTTVFTGRENTTMKTIALEQLPTETRTLVEGWLSEAAPITLSRGGFPCAELTQIEATDDLFDLMPEEEAELREVFRQGDEDFAAGRYITLDEFKLKNADKLSGKAK